MSSVNDDNIQNGISGTTDTFKEINAKEIQVEDPVNFLNLQEKQEYMLAHQETLVRGEIPLDKLSDSLQDEFPNDYDEDANARMTSRRREERYNLEEPAERAVSRHDSEKRERSKSVRREAFAGRAETVAATKSPEEEDLRYRDYDERSGLDKALSVAVKAGLVVIVILLLTMVIFLFLPSIKRAIGIGGDGTEAGAELTIPEDNLPQEGMQATQETPSAPAEGQQAETPAESGGQQGGSEETTVTVAADTLNLRDLPGWMEGSEVICKVERGEKLTVIGSEDGWLKVRYNGQEYYCSEEYVE